MRWVADTGPVLHLAEADGLELISHLGEVAIPPAVREELVRLLPKATFPPALRFAPLLDIHLAEANDWCRAGLLHRGEAQAIALARQNGADILLTDDASARLFATTLGLQARGSLGVVLWLAGQRRISRVNASRYLDRLAGTSLWVSSRVLAEARLALERLGGA
jgi:predicted nucleic acid-binding protein